MFGKNGKTLVDNLCTRRMQSVTFLQHPNTDNSKNNKDRIKSESRTCNKSDVQAEAYTHTHKVRGINFSVGRYRYMYADSRCVVCRKHAKVCFCCSKEVKITKAQKTTTMLCKRVRLEGDSGK